MLGLKRYLPVLHLLDDVRDTAPSRSVDSDECESEEEAAFDLFGFGLGQFEQFSGDKEIPALGWDFVLALRRGLTQQVRDTAPGRCVDGDERQSEDEAAFDLFGLSLGQFDDLGLVFHGSLQYGYCAQRSAGSTSYSHIHYRRYNEP
jgi:hypothetical protein